jgi:hypothetical protein
MAAPETVDSRLDSGTGYKYNLALHVVHDGSDAAADNGNNNNTFTCFTALPPELRLQIWEYLIQPRIVLVAYIDPRNDDLGHAQLWRHPYKPATPALLHVNHESRALALQHYEQAFSWMSPADSTRPTEPHAWFNFGLDALWFHGGLDVHGLHDHVTPMVSGFASDDARRVRHVAITLRALRRTRHPPDQEHGMLYSISQTFSSAQRLLITTWQQDAATLGPLPPLAAANGMLLNLWAKFVGGTTCVTSELQGKQILMLREYDLAEFIAQHC